VEGQTYYIRFGALPKSGYSTNFATGSVEAGVSTYEATGRNGRYEVHVPEEGEWADEDLSDRIRQVQDGTDTAYVVTGAYHGTGGDGEPLLRDVQVVREIDPALLRKRET
jgi:hypothetical protein